jgi:hypothetical protein
MANLLRIFLVILVLGFGVSAAWIITAGNSHIAPTADSFGNAPPDVAVSQDGQAAGLSTATMPVLAVAFLIAVMVALTSVFAWLWKTGKSNKSGY